MMNPVSLFRFDLKNHGDLFWEFYRGEEYAEFFRRFPPNWRREDVDKFEEATLTQVYAIYMGEEFIGFAHVGSICWMSLSTQAGLMLKPEYRDRSVGGNKLAFWTILALAHMLFDKMAFRRMSFKFLKIRSDIEHSLILGGLRKEAEFYKSVNFNGVWEDELEYCLDKENYNLMYK